MPSTATHAYFSLDVLEKLNNHSKKYIDNELIKAFSQGPDPIYFYNLASLAKGKYIRNKYTDLLHDSKTKDFFITLITEIKNRKLTKNKQVMSFLYGFITHYALDTTLHPYIAFKTGIYDKNNKETYKYKNLHIDMEVHLDCYMIFQKEQIPAKNFKLHNFCFNIKQMDNKFKELLDDICKSVYSIDNFSHVYYKSLKQMKNIYRIFRYDKTGIKKLGYKIIDKCLPLKQLNKEQLSYNVNYKNKLHYLNKEKNEWNHPMDQYETYNYSFVELYHIALNKAIEIINEVNKVLYEDNDIEVLNQVFKNISYRTGKDCNDKRKMKYFEY